MSSQPVDYKKELESASKTMIMIHDPNLLIRLIVRMIVGKVRIKHAGMILYEPERDRYVLNISRGKQGLKIPAGFARFDKNSPIIKLFTKKEYRPLTLNKSAIISNDLNKLIWQEFVLCGQAASNGNRELLHEVGTQMELLNVLACVPAYYHDKLLAVLLLGEKEEGGLYDQAELDFFAALASDAAMAIRNAQLFDQAKKEAHRNHDLFIRTTLVLGEAIEAKDKYTQGHVEGVAAHAVSIARQMSANGTAHFDEKFMEQLYIASLLHDIGKIGIPETILNKNGKLTDEEFAVMKNHPRIGGDILKPLSELKDSLDGVKYHHERYDGKGYPFGLKGEEIPIIAAIIGVADAFDAMITDRPYRKAMAKNVAVEEIKRNAGIQFHPGPANALFELFQKNLI